MAMTTMTTTKMMKPFSSIMTNPSATTRVVALAPLVLLLLVTQGTTAAATDGRPSLLRVLQPPQVQMQQLEEQEHQFAPQLPRHLMAVMDDEEAFRALGEMMAGSFSMPNGGGEFSYGPGGFSMPPYMGGFTMPPPHMGSFSMPPYTELSMPPYPGVQFSGSFSYPDMASGGASDPVWGLGGSTADGTNADSSTTSDAIGDGSSDQTSSSGSTTGTEGNAPSETAAAAVGDASNPGIDSDRLSAGAEIFFIVAGAMAAFVGAVILFTYCTVSTPPSSGWSLMNSDQASAFST